MADDHKNEQHTESSTTPITVAELQKMSRAMAMAAAKYRVAVEREQRRGEECSDLATPGSILRF